MQPGTFALLPLKPKGLSVPQLHLSRGWDSLVMSLASFGGSYFGDSGFDETVSGGLMSPPNPAVATKSPKNLLC